MRFYKFIRFILSELVGWALFWSFRLDDIGLMEEDFDPRSEPIEAESEHVEARSAPLTYARWRDNLDFSNLRIHSINALLRQDGFDCVVVRNGPKEILVYSLKGSVDELRTATQWWVKKEYAVKVLNPGNSA